MAALGDGEAAVAAARSDPPDVAVLDIRMPGLNGVQATRQIVGAGQPGRPVSVLILTTYGGDDLVYQALRAGAAGYLLKDHAPVHLVSAVRAVAIGEGWLDAAVTRAVISNIATQPVDAGLHQIAGLTDRERDVWLLLAQGRSNAEIALTLSIGLGTVKTHVSHLLTKLGLRDRTQAAAAAYRAGLL